MVEEATSKQEVSGSSPIHRVLRVDYCKINAKFNAKICKINAEFNDKYVRSAATTVDKLENSPPFLT